MKVKNEMFWVKLNFLILGLLLVSYFMYHLKTEGLGSGFSKFLGVKPAQQQQAQPVVSHGRVAKVLSATRLTWCDTRVKALIGPEGQKVIQKDLKWYRQSPGETELDFIAVEKWFGKNCSLKIVPMGGESADFSPVLTVEFIKGPSGQFQQSPQGEFKWKNRVFRSAELRQALAELAELPVAKPVK